MPLITKIETNFKTNERVFNLTRPHLCVHGANASGKTALLNAITLPLLGRATDLGARDEAKSGTLLRWLIPPDSKRAYSKITFSNGSEAYWELIKGKSPTHQPPPFEVSDPFSDAYAMLRAGRENVIRYFVEHFGPEERQGSAGNPWFKDIIITEERHAVSARAHKATMAALKKTAQEAYGVDIEGRVSPGVSELFDIYQRTKAMYEASQAKADACFADMESWFTANRTRIEALLRSDVLLQDVGIYQDKTQILVGRRDYKNTGTETLPLTSGAETVMVALKLASHARMRGPGVALAVIPDRDYDDKTKTKFMSFGAETPLTMIAQMTKLPPGHPNWEVLSV